MPQNKSITFSNNDQFDNSLIEVVGGKAQLKDNPPLIPNSTFWATYASSINADFGLGDTTGTAVGNASINNQKLDLSFSDLSYVSYSGIGNASYVQTGAIKFKYTPNYIDEPTSDMVIFLSEEIGSLNNKIEIIITANGRLKIFLYDSNGQEIGSRTSFIFTLIGVTYEVELDFDLDLGGYILFFDGIGGVPFGSPGVRSNTTNQILIGTDQSKTLLSNFLIEDLIIYDTVQHTSDYVPGYTLPDIYTTSNPTITTQASYNFKDILNFIEDATKPTGTEIKYILQDGLILKYWDGNNFVVSDGTYAQSNTATEIQNSKSLITFKNKVKLIIFLNSNGRATPIL